MADTIKTVKIAFELATDKVQKGISTLSSGFSSLSSKFQELKAQMSSKQGKESVSAYDAQIKKIVALKAQMAQLKSLYKDLQKAEATRVGAADARDAFREKLINDFSGFKEPFESFQQKVETNPELIQLAENARNAFIEVERLKTEIKELTGGDASQEGVATALFKTNEQIKEESANLRALQRDQESSSSSAKKAASSHKTFGNAMKTVGKTLKSVKSHIKSAVNGFKSIASSLKSAIPGANLFKGALGKLASQFKRLFVMRLLRNAIMQIINAFGEGTQNIARYSAALNGLDANNANAAMSELASTGLYLKNTIGSAVIPVLNALIPIIRAIATGFATAVNYVNQFMSALGGKSSWSKAKNVSVDYASTLDGVGSSAGGAKDAVEDLKRTILGFDEINKLNDAGSSGSGGGSGSSGGGSDSVNYADMFEEVPIDNKVTEWLKQLKPYIDDIKTAWGHVTTAVNDLVHSEGFQMLVGTALHMALTFVSTALEVIATLIGNVQKALDNSEIQGKISGIKEAWDGVTSAIKELVNSPGWQSVVNTVVFVGLSVLETVLNVIKGLIDAVRVAINKLDENGTLDAFRKAWDKVTKSINDFVNSEGFQAIVGTILEGALNLIIAALDVISFLVDSARKALDELSRSGVLDDLSYAFEEIRDAVKRITESEFVKNLMTGAFKHVIKQVSTVIEGIADVLGFVADVLEFNIPGALKHLSSFLMNLGKFLISSILVPIDAAVNGIIDLINQIAGTHIAHTTLAEDVAKAFDDAKETMNEFIDSLAEESEEKGAEAGRNYAEGYSSNAKPTATVSANTDKAEGAYTKFFNNVKGTQITAPVNANTTTAKQAYTLFKNDVDKGVTSPVSANLTNSKEVKAAMQSALGSITVNGTFSASGMYDIKTGLIDYLKGLIVNGTFSSGGKGAIKKDLMSYLNDLVLGGYISEADKYAMWKDLKSYFSDIPIKAKVSSVDTSYVSGMSLVLPTKMTPTYKAMGGFVNRATGGLVQAASGRLIDSSQIFMARENGIPEYVGRFGSHNAVANNYQIIEGISRGVADAMMSQNTLLQRQNSLLEEIASKNLEVTATSIASGLTRQNRRAGTTIVPVN